MKTFEFTVHECYKRAEYRCEWTDTIGWNSVRCPEEHLKPARTYKGKVVLVPYYESLKHQNMDTIKIYCTKHMNKAFEMKRKFKPRAKKVNDDQLNLLGGL